MEVSIGLDNIQQEKKAKLLGISFEDNQKWTHQVYGKNGVIAALNRRQYVIKRLKNHVNMKSLLKIVDGLFTSKIRYGLQLYGKVRRKDADPTSEIFKDIQIIQNNLMRYITGKKLSDKISIKQLLEDTNSLSINQMNAQIKLAEVWKSLNIQNYPLKVKRKEASDNMVLTRAVKNGFLVESGKKELTQNTCISDAIKLWNNAPREVQEANSLLSAKRLIKSFVKTLPI